MTKPVNRPELWTDADSLHLEKLDNGFLGISEDFLRQCFLRTELELVPESCPAELALRTSLIDDPYRIVSPAELASLADPDAVENYSVMLGFRDRLISAQTIEGCYLSAFAEEAALIPFIFLNHMVYLIAHNIFKNIDDPFILRSAELLFRKQAINIYDGAILSIDHETARSLEHQNANLGNLGRSLVKGGVIPNPNELDVMNVENAPRYWARSGHFEYVLDLTFARPGLQALCCVMEQWIRHLLMVDVKISPLQEIVDDHWVWHTGLDVDSSALLNDLYHDQDISNDRKAQLLSLFQLEFADTAIIKKETVGHPVYMALCMDQNNRLQLKPQNLLFNMPLVNALN